MVRPKPDKGDAPIGLFGDGWVESINEVRRHHNKQAQVQLGSGDTGVIGEDAFDGLAVAVADHRKLDVLALSFGIHRCKQQLRVHRTGPL